MLNLPNGYQGACAIITAIGHRVPGIVSLAAISDTRILVGFTKGDVENERKLLTDLIEKLSITTVPMAPNVQSVAMRLYYDRDAVSVASVVQTAFSQLKVASVSMNPSNTYRDTIVIADPTGSSSAEVLDQAQRMVAQLDEPRAQVVVNAWSLQVSSDDSDIAGQIVPEARRLASGYNDALEAAVTRGWKYVNNTSNNLRFNELFVDYLCYVVVVENATWITRNLNSRCPGGEHRFPVASPFQKTFDTQTAHSATKELQYSLGYSSLFGNETPDLLQMLILVMASDTPGDVADATLNEMEGLDAPYDKCLDTAGSSSDSRRWSFTTKCQKKVSSCQEIDRKFYQAEDNFLSGDNTPSGSDLTSSSAVTATVPSANNSAGPKKSLLENAKTKNAPRFVGFGCIREKLHELTEKGKGDAVYSTSTVGQFRAAVADYLFQNKMKDEYSNDFNPYLFPASAASLDAVLTPIVEAFNQDLNVLQQHLQDQLTEGSAQDKHLHYRSNGLVSVKVISGNQAAVQTQSLNYFPQNPVLSLQDFAKSIATAQQATNPVALLGGSLSSVAATMGAFAAAQPAQVTAKVGSGLSLTVTPFTLSSAKGAELNVNVTYNENGAATLSSDSTKSNATDDLNSRVAEHEVTTLVRMDSLKFFEISTMQSVIARERSPWKPFDPLFELPLINTPGIVIARRKPQVIYDQSIIFLEASIMPTAADLGQGLLYQRDLVGTTSGCVEATGSKSFVFEEYVQNDWLKAVMEYHKSVITSLAGQYVDGKGQVQTQKTAWLLAFPNAVRKPDVPSPTSDTTRLVPGLTPPKKPVPCLTDNQT